MLMHWMRSALTSSAGRSLKCLRTASAFLRWQPVSACASWNSCATLLTKCARGERGEREYTDRVRWGLRWGENERGRGRACVYGRGEREGRMRGGGRAV